MTWVCPRNFTLSKGRKRFVKKQQMQWTSRARTSCYRPEPKFSMVIFEETFRRWYPAFRSKTEAEGSMTGNCLWNLTLSFSQRTETSRLWF